MRTPSITAKTKRPPDKRQRTGLVGVRLLPAELEQLRSTAARENVSPGEILRRAFTRYA